MNTDGMTRTFAASQGAKVRAIIQPLSIHKMMFRGICVIRGRLLKNLFKKCEFASLTFKDKNARACPIVVGNPVNCRLVGAATTINRPIAFFLP
jgi:hypothetical protein